MKRAEVQIPPCNEFVTTAILGLLVRTGYSHNKGLITTYRPELFRLSGALYTTNCMGISYKTAPRKSSLSMQLRWAFNSLRSVRRRQTLSIQIDQGRDRCNPDKVKCTVVDRRKCNSCGK